MVIIHFIASWCFVLLHSCWCWWLFCSLNTSTHTRAPSCTHMPLITFWLAHVNDGWQDTFSMSQHEIETKEFSCLGKLRKRNSLVKNVCPTSVSVTHHPRCQREILTRAIELRKNIPLLQRFQETGNEFSSFSLFLFFNLVLMVLILYARLLLSIECHSLSLSRSSPAAWSTGLSFPPRGIRQTFIAKRFLLAFMRSMNIWLSEFHLTDARLPLSCSVSHCVCVCAKIRTISLS